MELPRSIEPALPGRDEPKRYGVLTVERRALLTHEVTISIQNIARLVLGIDRAPVELVMSQRAKVLIGSALVAALVLAVMPNMGVIVGDGRLMQGLAVVIAILGPLIGTNLPRDSRKLGVDRWHIDVITSDAGRYRFAADDRIVIDKVRRIITDKINNHDEPTVYNVNFEKGVIENMGVGQVGSIGAIVSGSGNSVTAAAGNARIGTTEISNSPFAQAGTGNNSTGNVAKVDYAETMPTLEQWIRHFKGQEQVERRLTELAELMRTGTPTAQSKSKVKSLADDLITLFRGASEAVTLFGSITRAAGF